MKDLINAVLSLVLILAILYAPECEARPDPPAAPACIVAAIGIVCAGVMVYGLYKMCQAIPPADQDQDPPDNPPVDQIPGMGPPSIMHPLPPLHLRSQAMNARVSLQHSDGNGGWQTDYTFALTASQIGGRAMVAYDSNGVPLLTNDVPVVGIGGQNYAGFNFTNLPAIASNSPARMFRLLAQ